MVFVFLELRPHIVFGIKLKISVFHKCQLSGSVKIFPIFLKTISAYYLLSLPKVSLYSAVCHIF